MGWILQKENANEIISEATSSQTRQNQKRKNFEEDLEMDKKLLNRRLVYEPTVPRNVIFRLKSQISAELSFILSLDRKSRTILHGPHMSHIGYSYPD